MKYESFKSAPSRNRRKGFTLVELLVTITIIVVLAALSTIMVKRAIVSSQRASCVSILRQHGIALFGYLADNNDQMPNIQSNWTRPIYSNKNMLFGHTYPYLGLEKPSGPIPLPESLVCPAWRKRFPKWNANGRGDSAGSVYAANQDQMVGGVRLFGSQGVPPGDPTFKPGANYSKILEGTANNRASNIPLLSDGQGLINPKESADPVHGTMRNCLYLDMHVESRPYRQSPMGPVK